MVMQYRPLILAVLLTSAMAAHADPAPFDLAGPTLQVTVARGGKTLPMSEVPNLIGGDQLSIKADLPSTQSAHYLMVAVFLRGSTNPPPDEWFIRCETWKGKCAQEGLHVTVPQDAQQLLMFLAPETSGDFRTLVGAVRGRPGVFVRTSQDLNQATLDRSRLESYLSAIRALNEGDRVKLKDAAPLLARSLAIKVDEKCLDRIPELQAGCLMQGQGSLILDDGHSTSIVEALTSGATGDLAMQASFTPQLSYGYYSPYIASVMDIARIFDSFRTAQYQYIPALGTLHGDQLALTLNTPPSFHNPKSVIVTALPAVERSQLPPLHPVDAKELLCATKSTLVLPVEGAPLVFSTDYAHEMTLSLTTKDKTIDLPVKADPVEGGLVVDTRALAGVHLGDTMQGSVHGSWGFEKYDGPTFHFVNPHAQAWQLGLSDPASLIAGREEIIHLRAGSASCIDTILLKDPAGKELKADWTAVKADEVAVKLPLQAAEPGALTLLVKQHGVAEPQSFKLQAYSEAAHLDHFTVHAGDTQGILKGARLDEVSDLAVDGVDFVPQKLATNQGSDELTLEAHDAQAAAGLKPGDATAKISLKDGRAIDLKTLIDTPRPSAALIAKSVQPSNSQGDSNIQLTDQNELPQDAKLTFSVRAKTPRAFTHDEAIEVATADEAFSTSLSIGNGKVTLENANVAVASFSATKAFGPSAYGPLRFRLVSNGVSGEWQNLVTLVRLPVLKDLKCPATSAVACKLSGSELFLVQAMSNDPQFAHAVQVPDGFPGYSLPVPHPTDGQLYVKLRDDPSVINLAAVPTQQLAPTAEEADRAPAVSAAVNSDSKAGAPGADAGKASGNPTPAASASQAVDQAAPAATAPPPNLPAPAAPASPATEAPKAPIAQHTT
jgi:hypothetical protein